MFLIDGLNTIPAKPARTALGAAPGWFEQNPGAGAGTVLTGEWLNMLQAEIKAVLDAAGIALDKANDGQVLAAIQSLIAGALPQARRPFRAHKNSVDQGIGANTWTKITFGFTEFNSGSAFDTVNSRWVPPAGFYLLTAGYAHPSGPGSGMALHCAIAKNGNNIAQSTVRSNDGGEYHVPAVVVPVQANGTDYFEAHAYAQGSGITINGTLHQTWFGGL